MAEKAAKVTMLQRSPTYIAPEPSVDTTATFLRKWLTSSTVHTLMRVKMMLRLHFLYKIAKRYPELVKRTVKERVRGSLPPDFDVDKHFTPSYATAPASAPGRSHQRCAAFPCANKIRIDCGKILLTSETLRTL
jgi:cation diffusion facilitator CzcD-associated flavoprotein CzcO